MEEQRRDRRTLAAAAIGAAMLAAALILQALAYLAATHH
jgi:hypothetical protein